MNTRLISRSLILGILVLLAAASGQAQTVQQKRLMLDQAKAAARNLRTEKESASDDAAAGQTQQGGRVEIQGADKKQAIAGSWIGDVTITSPPEFAGSFKSLICLTDDGRLVATAQGDIVDPVQSPGTGVWQYQAGRVFALSFKTLFYESQGDGAGSLIGVATIRSTSTVSDTGDKFSGPFKFALVDTQGNVLLETQGTWQFTAIKLEPLQ